ncbi:MULTISPECIES: hypothetical protein [Pseudomonas]|jgi:hypothetical protein|uniref:hypothetical protein n=1 Tax=Pseudomonas TaxID=286 RepID=UPI0018D79B7E|nr:MULTISPECIES: hypothetical protein [Pseudomonas]MBH3371909.1 hypothetical protein [Pseudomonas juntendi]
MKFVKVINCDDKKGQAVEVEHKHLAKTLIFQVALGLPVLAGLLLGLAIYAAESGLSACFSSDCVQTFFTIYKFPLAIAGLALPLVAMVAAIHRSMEAAIQIKITSGQFREALVNNRFGNYIKHREAFEKSIDGYCSRLSDHTGVKTFVLVHALYGQLFPNAAIGNFEWTGQHSAKFLGDAERRVKTLIEESSKKPDQFDFDKFFNSLRYLLQAFSLNYVSSQVLYYQTKNQRWSYCHVTSRGDLPNSAVEAAQDLVDLLRVLKNYVGIYELDACDVDVSKNNLLASFNMFPERLRRV